MGVGGGGGGLGVPKCDCGSKFCFGLVTIGRESPKTVNIALRILRIYTKCNIFSTMRRTFKNSIPDYLFHIKSFAVG